MSKFIVSIVIIVVLAVLGLVTPVSAQEQAAPPAAIGHNLADAAMPSPVLSGGLEGCVVTLAPVLGPKDAKKACLDALHTEADRAKSTAKSAAKSTDPYDPCSGLNPPRGCIYQYGYGGGGYGYGPVYQPRRRQPAYGANTTPPKNEGGRTTTGTAVRRGR